MSVSRSAAGSPRAGERVEHDEQRVDLAEVAEQLRAGARTSTTRTAAGVTFFAWTISASRSSRSSAIAAIPTFSLPNSPAPVRVGARNNVVFPDDGSPTMPTSSATAAEAGYGAGGEPLELLLQRDEGPVLQRLDRALGLPRIPPPLRSRS